MSELYLDDATLQTIILAVTEGKLESVKCSRLDDELFINILRRSIPRDIQLKLSDPQLLTVGSVKTLAVKVSGSRLRDVLYLQVARVGTCISRCFNGPDPEFNLVGGHLKFNLSTFRVGQRLLLDIIDLNHVEIPGSNSSVSVFFTIKPKE